MVQFKDITLSPLKIDINNLKCTGQARILPALLAVQCTGMAQLTPKLCTFK